MSLKSVARVAVPAVFAAFALSAAAQQPNPMDVVPDKMPNDIPYGAPIALDHAQAAINAAVAESKKLYDAAWGQATGKKSSPEIPYNSH